MIFKETIKNFDLSKKTALITGAGGLLGFEHAFALLDIGSNVILTDISEKKLDLTKKRLQINYIKNACPFLSKKKITDTLYFPYPVPVSIESSKKMLIE